MGKKTKSGNYVNQREPQSLDRYVGSRVRMRRMMLGMSQEDLGQKLGISFQQVQKYEKGTNRIGAARLARIAAVMDTEMNFFFEGGPSAGAGSKSVAKKEAASQADLDLLSFMSDNLGPRMVRAFPGLNPAVKRSLVEMAERIAGGVAE